MADSEIIVEKNYRRNIIQGIMHTLCLIIPIAFAFAGYFIASPIWNSFFDTDCSELFKFFCSGLLYTVSVTFIFFKTRNTNPIMKIRVFMKK